MTDGTITQEDYLVKAKKLVVELEAGNEDNVQLILEELVSNREKKMFNELGKLTREFHDALMRFRLDSKIADLTESDIPDARERLRHVISMTSESAEKTLSAVETSIPLCDKLSSEAELLKNEWAQFMTDELDANDVDDLKVKVSEFLSETSSDTRVVKDHLNVVLMAQSFQDLTGQIITKVINLVDEVEENLVNLVKLSCDTIADSSQRDDKEESARDKLAGPVVPGVVTKDTVSDQDEVDDLLSSLGF